MPPKQGQSQFISPVSSLKAPSLAASSSRSAAGEGASSVAAGDEDGVEAMGVAGDGPASRDNDCWGCDNEEGAVTRSVCVGAVAAAAVCFCLRESAIVSSVGSLASSGTS